MGIVTFWEVCYEVHRGCSYLVRLVVLSTAFLRIVLTLGLDLLLLGIVRLDGILLSLLCVLHASLRVGGDFLGMLCRLLDLC